MSREFRNQRGSRHPRLCIGGSNGVGRHLWRVHIRHGCLRRTATHPPRPRRSADPDGRRNVGVLSHVSDLAPARHLVAVACRGLGSDDRDVAGSCDGYAVHRMPSIKALQWRIIRTAPHCRCTRVQLELSPTKSSSHLMAEHVCEQLRSHGVKTDTLRCADYAIAPGVEADMGDGDEWPKIRDRVLGADICWCRHLSGWGTRPASPNVCSSVSTPNCPIPTTMAGRSCTARSPSSRSSARGRSHKVFADCAQGLNDIGFSFAAQANTYWNGEAMHTTNYDDLDEVPEPVAKTTASAARNAAHLAGLLRAQQYPPQQ